MLLLCVMTALLLFKPVLLMLFLFCPVVLSLRSIIKSIKYIFINVTNFMRCPLNQVSGVLLDTKQMSTNVHKIAFM